MHIMTALFVGCNTFFFLRLQLVEYHYGATMHVTDNQTSFVSIITPLV